MKILIIHASAGAGHRRAAEALRNGFQGSSHNVTLVDALDYTSPFFKRMYGGMYAFLITKLPAVWGFAFYLIDIPVARPLIRLVRRIYNAINAGKLHQFLIEENFDYIFSTHFLPNEVASALKREGQIRSEIISIITDYDVHSIWLAEGIDHYCVASDWTKKKLLTMGIRENCISITGIPTDPKFALKRDKKILCQAIGSRDDLFTVLVATGSFGIGPIERIIKHLEGFQVLVVCGHNTALYERLKAHASDLIKIFGLVNNMDELMAISNAMVTKPGGLSISEALVSGLPLIFFSAIPGQETHNIRVLKTYGIGISDCSVEEIARELKTLKSSPELYTNMVDKINNLAKPGAVKDIISLL
jgi:processive 1,2-diacylglycerol beta-glucosyltransferase